MDGRTVWEKRPDETEGEFNLFQRYLAQGNNRNVVRMAGFLKKDVLYLSHRMDWFNRANAYDLYIQRVLLAERDAQLQITAQQVTEEHKSILHDARSVIMNEISLLADQVREQPGEKVKLSELIKLMDLTIKADRLIRDQTTENVSTDWNVSSLSPEDLRKLDELHQKAARSERDKAK